MIKILNHMIREIEDLNKDLEFEIVSQQMIDDAYENVNEAQEDINKIQESINAVQNTHEKNKKASLAIVLFNLHFGDLIQDLQNISEFIEAAAKKHNELANKNDKV